jgi:hypothetical protein
MTVQLLIDSIVRQITVLIAQLATSGGIRAPVAHIANQVFVELANELHAQGVSRKVSADMFGMALSAYIRKLRRLSEGQTEAGKSLWQAVLEFIRTQDLVTRKRVAERFARDDELQVTAILRDLTESGLVFCSGSGPMAMYRAASSADLKKLSQLSVDSGLDELVLAIAYRLGPCTADDLQEALGRPVGNLTEVLDRLVNTGQMKRDEQARYCANALILPIGSAVGWEAAVFDHIQAMVQTICQRVRADQSPNLRDVVGGSTYTCEVWPGHPLEEQVKAQLEALRKQCHELRKQVTEYNVQNGVARKHEQVVTYVGQCVMERDLDVISENEGDPSNE